MHFTVTARSKNLFDSEFRASARPGTPILNLNSRKKNQLFVVLWAALRQGLPTERETCRLELCLLSCSQKTGVSNRSCTILQLSLPGNKPTRTYLANPAARATPTLVPDSPHRVQWRR